ncbi:BTAD domain-containing putative transcriptional regulator [Gordonia sp. ABSL1-1]|uniref:AfsR/SARP family transcriptional regulator n=1 Tax=Gordonia sp. ABSL1-1 TaxID=3053923 RepID=UPI002572C92C|nr:BTAD domain-containing putative transcriptional regulator [Gordonia sp. ABSL1-1]MDL9935706.1 BTAD domain-containing putative transcriptional regulator [Gordonia sp. ABSL1-1]
MMFELVSVLGPTTVLIADDEVPVTSGRLRALATSLTLAHPHAVGVEHIVDDVWPDDPPRQPVGAVHTLISRLRTLVGTEVVESTVAGYRWRVPHIASDVGPDPVSDLAAAEAIARDPDDRRATAALALWRAEPGAALPPGPLRDRLQVRARRCHQALLEHSWTHRLATDPRRVAEEIAAHREHGADLDERLAALEMHGWIRAGDANRALGVFAAVRGALAEELGVDPGSELLAAHTAALRSGRDTDGGVVAELTATPPPPRNEFVPRPALLAELRSALTESPVVCVVGPGGIGKTRLVAHHLAAHHRADSAGRTDPDVFVDLSAAHTAADVTAAVAAAVGSGAVFDIDSATGPPTRSPATMLAQVLPSRALIVFDACELVAGVVSDLVREVGDLRRDIRVLATSRVPLDPGTGRIIEVTALPESSAAQLFTVRARDIAPQNRLDPDAVGALCRRLDGAPLALELAAAQLRHLTLADLIDRLDADMTVLRVGDGGRHHSLADVVKSSWELLPVPAREALAALARFSGVFSLDDALTFDEVDIDHLGTLCAHGLLRVVDEPDSPGDNSTGRTHYRLTETIRDFARERTAALPSLAEHLAARHRRWAGEQVRDALTQLRTGQVAQAAAAFDRTAESILSLLDPDSPPDLTLLPAVSWRWLRTGGHDDTVRLCRAAVQAASAGNADPVGLCFAIVHLVSLGAYRDAARGRILLRRIPIDEDTPGIDTLGRTLLVAPPRTVGRILATAADATDPVVAAAADLVRAEVAERSANPVFARRCARRAGVAADRAAHPWLSANARGRLGRISSQLGEYPVAAIHFERSAEIFDSIGLREDAARMRVHQAAATVGVDRAAAAELLAECLHDSGAGHRPYVATAHMARAQLLIDSDADRALSAADRALSIVGAPSDGHSVHLHAVAVALLAHAGRTTHARIAADDLEAALDRRLHRGDHADLPSLGAAAAAIVKARGLAPDSPPATAARTLRHRRDFAVLALPDLPTPGSGSRPTRAAAIHRLLR